MFLKIFNQLMAENKLDDAGFAKVSKIPYGTVRGWTHLNRLPDYNALIKVADFFGISVDYLMGREDELGIIKINANLSSDEDELLRLHRKLSDRDKLQVLGFAKGLCSESKEK